MRRLARKWATHASGWRRFVSGCETSKKAPTDGNQALSFRPTRREKAGSPAPTFAPQWAAICRIFCHRHGAGRRLGECPIFSVSSDVWAPCRPVAYGIGTGSLVFDSVCEKPPSFREFASRGSSRWKLADTIYGERPSRDDLNLPDHKPRLLKRRQAMPRIGPATHATGAGVTVRPAAPSE